MSNVSQIMKIKPDNTDVANPNTEQSATVTSLNTYRKKLLHRSLSHNQRIDPFEKLAICNETGYSHL